jgi:hypothetical protein
MCTQALPCILLLPSTLPEPLATVQFSMPLDVLVVPPAARMGAVNLPSAPGNFQPAVIEWPSFKARFIGSPSLLMTMT